MSRDEGPPDTPAAGRVRVFVCDDAPWMCELIEYWLDDHDELQLVGKAYSRAAALDGIAHAVPDVVILDTMTHEGDRVAVDDIRRLAPAAGVLVFSGYPVEVSATLLPEADGYRSKDDGQVALVSGIHGALAAAQRRR